MFSHKNDMNERERERERERENGEIEKKIKLWTLNCSLPVFFVALEFLTPIPPTKFIID